MKILNVLTWHPKKLKDALLPVSVINWISGLHFVEIPVGHPRPILSLIYLMSMIILYYYSPIVHGYSACKFNTIQGSNELIFIFGWVLNAFTAMIIIITCLYNQKVRI